MMHKIFRPLLDCKTPVDKGFDKNHFKQELKRQTISKYKDYYFDYTASGLAFKAIEDRLQEFLELYANTHSKESYLAAQTTEIYDEARVLLKQYLELDDSFAILPAGTGCTAAIKKMQELLGIYISPMTKKRFDINPKNKPVVFIGPYEHHSNDVSFREALCDLERIPLNEKGLIDLDILAKRLEQHKNREIIASFALASNVTGIISPYQQIAKLVRQYKGKIFFDCASSAAYMNIDKTYFDGVFISSHKLLGGPGTCGLLVIKKDLIDNDLAPTFGGGGNVEYVSSNTHSYVHDQESREDVGTPAILQLVKTALAFQLRNEIGLDFIKSEKDELLQYFLNRLNTVPDLVNYSDQNTERLSIISFNLKQNPFKVCEILSQDFGLQLRAGCSCASPYGHALLNIQDDCNLEKPGWVRASIHYSHSKNEIDYLIEALGKIAKVAA